jgi:uncharacterized BrkB/YihY/UPF0761 family membrane protein
MVWLYMVSLVILIGAEFNAVRYPRYLFGTFSKLGTDGDSSERSSENL